MVTMLAGIMGLVATEMVENDNDTDKGTNMGRVKVFFIVTLLGGFMCLGTLQRIPAPVN
jgi:hypothetical protein